MKPSPVANEQTDYGTSTESACSDIARDQLWHPLRQAIHEGTIPGAVAAVSYRGQSYYYAGGWATDTPALRVPATIDTIYDCASLTKIAVTLPLILILVQQGRIALDDPVARYIHELHHGTHAAITIRQLLAHTSGLPAIIDCYSQHWTMDEAIRQISHLELQSRPGLKRTYSDPGYILLGWLFQTVSGMTLAEGAQKLLWQPLHMHNSLFCPPSSLAARIASTEYDAAYADWLRGIVHDENARQLGGIVGHAGLFSTAGDLLRYGQSWLAGVNERDCNWLGLEDAHASTDSPIESNPYASQPNEQHPASEHSSFARLHHLTPLLRTAIRRQTPVLPHTHRGLGWVLDGDEADVSGGLLSPAAFGHTGFTGTSLYVDPGLELVVVLLTNRVHYGRQHSIQHVRRDLHSAVATHVRACNR